MTFKRVLIDVDTQQDFLSRDGALPVCNRTEAIDQLMRVMAWVRSHNVPVVSSLDTHAPNTTFNGTPKHCVEGSRGQRKLPFTLMRQHRLVETDTMLSLPPDLLTDYPQLIFRKRNNDFFSNPKADRLLTRLEAEEIIVLGVGIEDCIRRLVMGLLARHKCVTIVPDACGRWNNVDADLAARLMAAKGARVLAVDELLSLNGSVAVRVARNGRPVAHHHAVRPGTNNGRSSARNGVRRPRTSS